MRGSRVKKAVAVTVAVAAISVLSVTFNRLAAFTILPALVLPEYSEPADRTDYDGGKDVFVKQDGRRLTVYRDGEKIWKTDRNIHVQDFLLADVDHDGSTDLLVLCWKRGRYGSHRPTWVKHDELGFSQHIYIYEITQAGIRPKWMASDTGIDVASWEFADGALYLTDTEGEVTGWVWKSWGLEKL